ncbi:MAG TPA: hypothetical protein VK888_01625 [Anaerolineales bacterium]|nr:hypothetical protein [Anaerolineales bacterium]
MKKRLNSQVSDIPKIGAPAQRALAAAGVKQLKDLTKFSEQEVSLWHGIGPNALGKLRQAMAEKGFSFK